MLREFGYNNDLKKTGKNFVEEERQKRKKAKEEQAKAEATAKLLELQENGEGEPKAEGTSKLSAKGKKELLKTADVVVTEADSDWNL